MSSYGYDERKGAYGLEAEKVIADLLSERYSDVIHFDDYDNNSQHEWFQNQRIDIAVPIRTPANTDSFCFIDVKRNIKPSGLFVIEGNQLGWLFASRSHLIVHVDLETPKFVWYNRIEMCERIEELLATDQLELNDRQWIWTGMNNTKLNDIMYREPFDLIGKPR